jgi:hypothetical protein
MHRFVFGVHFLLFIILSKISIASDSLRGEKFSGNYRKASAAWQIQLPFWGFQVFTTTSNP